MRIWVISGMITIAYILQSTVLQYIEIGHVKPNLIIMIVIYYALLRGNVEGAVAGFIGGMVIDIFGGKIFGVYALIGMYVGISAGYFNKRFFKENYFVLMFFMFIFTFAHELLFYFTYYFLWGETHIVFALKNIIMPVSIYNAVLALPIFGIIFKVNYWLVEREKMLRKY